MSHEIQTVSVPEELRSTIAAARRAGKRIGVVPTMGALHAGHLSLVEASCRECGFTVATIFVNPTQFGPGEDFQRYPRPLANDLKLLSDYPVDLVFAPEQATMYPPGSTTFVDVGPVAEPWEGVHRPGHFRGVATVVLKLFNLVAPDVAWFGQKDYQQTLVVRQMVRDLDVPVEIRVCPTIREPDGLAMSSRNVYLSPTERRQAIVSSRSLRLAEHLVAAGERRTETLLARMQALLATEREVQVQYVAIVDPQTLAPVDEVGAGAVALIAAKVGATRLIDNVLLKPSLTR
jgi:pantoate--beta-alanine ligase